MDYSNKALLLEKVLIKISGEYLAGNKEFGINPETLSEIARKKSRVFEMTIKIMKLKIVRKKGFGKLFSFFQGFLKDK